jgi:predicted anti-sigma-YlaC factor YlaD
MTQNSHQQIRRLIATSADDLSDAQQALLHAHLQHCGSCHDYAAATAEILRALRGIPVAADPRLVFNTQARVRARAFVLRQRQQWLTLVALACTFVGLSAAMTTPLIWWAFDWIGTHTGLSRPLWQAAFAFYWMVPALLVSVLLLFRGTHLANGGHSGDSSEGNKLWN